MAAVVVTDVQCLDNPSLVTNPFQFEISFECVRPLEADLEWKLIYVGSADNEQCDQVLDSVEVGPLQPGFMKFVFQADPPDLSLIPSKDLLEVTVLLLTCSYREKEFIRVGYYVYNSYITEELKLNPPEQPVLNQISRHILADQPRVTKWQNPWDDKPAELPTPLLNTPTSTDEPLDMMADDKDEVMGDGGDDEEDDEGHNTDDIVDLEEDSMGEDSPIRTSTQPTDTPAPTPIPTPNPTTAPLAVPTPAVATSTVPPVVAPVNSGRSLVAVGLE